MNYEIFDLRNFNLIRFPRPGLGIKWFPQPSFRSNALFLPPRVLAPAAAKLLGTPQARTTLTARGALERHCINKFPIVPESTIVNTFLFCQRATRGSRGTRLRWLELYGSRGGQNARRESEGVAFETQPKRSLNSQACPRQLKLSTYILSKHRFANLPS